MLGIIADTVRSTGKMLKSVATVPAMAHEALVAYSEVGLESALNKANDKRKYIPLEQVKRESKLADRKAALKTQLMEAQLQRVKEAQEVAVLKVRVVHAEAQNQLIQKAAKDFDPTKPLRKAEILATVLSPEMGAETMAGTEKMDIADKMDDDTVSPEAALNEWLR